MKQDDREEGSFLERWSRRKRGVEPEAEPERVEGADSFEGAPAGAEAAPANEEPAEPVSEKDFADFDFDGLDYESDYRQFMQKDVSEAARQKALRKLWISNPVLANMDGLDDYCEDYTDAAVCLPTGTMKTLYKYGRGFLDDDEVAKWEALGQESKQVADAEAAARRAAVAAETGADPAPGSEAPTEGAASVASAQSPTEIADTGPGAACAAAIKQDEGEMLAEFEAENSADEDAAKKHSQT